jgi:hypothetical protein
MAFFGWTRAELDAADPDDVEEAVAQIAEEQALRLALAGLGGDEGA